MVSIYVLKEPTTGAVRYVGQSANPLSRLKHHRLGEHGNERSNAWLSQLKEIGQDPVMEVVDTVEDADANAAEKKRIAQFMSSGADLLNATHVLPRERTYVKREHEAPAKTCGDKRLLNRGVKGNRGGGRKLARRPLMIDGVLQDGHYVVVSIDRNTVVLETTN